MTFIDQGRFDPRLKGYKTPDGFKLEIVASEPTVINPVGMTFGPDGTLFVLEWQPDANSWPETPEKIVYKDGTTRSIATMKKKVKDVVKVLTWNGETNTFDRAKVILEDELPSSILIHDGWLYTSGRGTVRRWKLADVIDGKNVSAKPEVIARGFCGFHHHQVSGLSIGLDGWLYITSGDNDNYVEGSDGSRATVLRTGAVFRCKPDGSKMEVFSIGYRNPYRDIVQDNLGSWFHADNDNEDGSKFTGCRIMHVAEASDFGWRLFTGSTCCKPDLVRGAVYGELPGKLPPMLKTGRGAPAGLLIYNDTQLPDYYRGLLYYPDVFRKLIRAYAVQPQGSTFSVTHEFEYIMSDDPLFRPCQMITGPDGAIYICDWRTDSGGAGKLFGDGVHGRIYRMTWAGGKAPGRNDQVPALELRPMSSWAKLLPKVGEQGSLNDLFDALSSADVTLRVLAQRELLRRVRADNDISDKEKAWYVDEDHCRQRFVEGVENDGLRLEARLVNLAALNQLWNDDVRDRFVAWLHEKTPAIRRIAAEGLSLNCRPGDKKAQEALVKALADTDWQVKRAVVLAIGKINAEGAADALAAEYKFDDGHDAYLTDAYLRALERCGRTGIDKLLGLAKSGDDADRIKAVAAFESLRMRPGAEAIVELLADPHLSTDQRISMIKSYTNYLLDPPVSLTALVDFIANHAKEPPALQRAVIETLAETGNLKGAKVANVLTNLFDAEDVEDRLAAIHAAETARFVEAAPRLVQALGVKGRDTVERVAILKALRVLNDKSSAPAIKNIFDSPEPASLRLEALRTLAAIDPAAAATVAGTVLEQPDRALQSEAVQILGSKPDGAKLIGQCFVDKKLPAELLPQVADALRKHAAKDPELAALLTEVMKGGLLLSLDAGQVERVRQLVLTKGSPQRGKSLYLSSKSLNCVNCHKLEGVGGQVGPDLTRLWDTAPIGKIMESIIEPSKEIKEGFQSFKVMTKGGQTFTGLKVVDKPDEIVIRDATATDVRIARNDVDEIVASKVSLMPDNVVSQLSFDQFIDLIAFLTSRDAQESLRGTATEFWVTGPFGGDLRTNYGPEIKTGEKETYIANSNARTNWQARNTAANGYLDLRSLFGKDKISAYALTYVYSPKAQTATMFIGANGDLRAWVNGEMIHEYAMPRQAAPDSDKVKVEVRTGWNPVLVKIVNGADAHGLYLRFSGEGIRISIKRD